MLDFSLPFSLSFTAVNSGTFLVAVMAMTDEECGV